MSNAPAAAAAPRLAARSGRRLKVAHLTTVDMSLALLLPTELRVDVEAGFDVYGISAPGPYVADVERLGVAHLPVASLTRAWDPRRDARAARELWGVLRDLRPDVLHTHNPKTGVLGRVLGRLAGIPVVVNTCHGLWAAPDDPLPKRAVVYAAEAAAAWCSDAELYQNGADRQILRRLTPRRRAAVVGNGTDLQRFRPDPVSRASVRRELGVADGELLVGGVGRRVAEKGVAEFVAAARALDGKASFVWVGPDDPDKAPPDLGGGGAVRFVGLRRDVEAFYSALDVFVLPSHREGFSRSAMEAAASGCAMVLTDIRGCREIGHDGEHLLLVPPRDPDALATAVDRLLRDAPLRRRLGANARRRALECFDQRQVAAASLATYAAVAARKGIDWPAPPADAMRGRP